MAKYKNINADNYDFLWTVGFPYLYCSIYLKSGYEKRDFIAYNDGISHTLFVSKNERKKLGKIGLNLYKKGFTEYDAYIRKKHIMVRKELEKNLRKDISGLTNKELAREFNDAVKLCIEMWKDYFFTEYHSTDLVAEILSEKDRKHDLKLIQKNVRRMSKLKFYQRENINKTIYSPSLMDKFISEIEKRFSLKRDIKNYNYLELIDILKGKKINVPDRSGSVARGLFLKNKDIIGPKAEKIFNQLQKINKNIKGFSGKVGNGGYYKGTVKIISFSVDTDFSKEINRMEKGQVLVSGSTGPEMLLACKKAGAIITDEGGITSHAALVSRELGIPSVIGTKIATKVLKDGDLVEVDADKGIVKILKRK